MKGFDLSDFMKSNSWIEGLCKPCSVTSCKTWDYPVLQKDKGTEVTFQYEKRNKCEAIIRLGTQDGIYVGAYNFSVGCSCVGDGGGGFAPGRKWGEFNSKHDADLYYSFYLLKRLMERAQSSARHKSLTSGCIQELIEHIDSIIPQQLELFSNYKEVI